MQLSAIFGKVPINASFMGKLKWAVKIAPFPEFVNNAHALESLVLEMPRGKL
jgi:hypothetical protein